MHCSRLILSLLLYAQFMVMALCVKTSDYQKEKITGNYSVLAIFMLARMHLMQTALAAIEDWSEKNMGMQRR